LMLDIFQEKCHSKTALHNRRVPIIQKPTMQFIVIADDNRREDEPSVSLSVSHEGTDIVFENFMGNLSKINNPQPSPVPTSVNQTGPDEAATIEDVLNSIFDDPVDVEESELSIFADNQEEESELEEGYSSNHTAVFKMPDEADDDVDVLDSILLDLDEKTKEMLGQDEVEAAATNQAGDEPQPPPKPSMAKPHLKEKEPEPQRASLVAEWEFECAESKSSRRGIRVLLSSLPRVLPQCLTHKWKAVTVSDLLTEKKLKRQYHKAVLIVHPDRSQARGDAAEIQERCCEVFQALESAWSACSK